MRKSLLSLIVAGLMTGTASAHIGDNIYLVYEIADADVSSRRILRPALAPRGHRLQGSAVREAH